MHCFKLKDGKTGTDLDNALIVVGDLGAGGFGCYRIIFNPDFVEWVGIDVHHTINQPENNYTCDLIKN